MPSGAFTVSTKYRHKTKPIDEKRLLLSEALNEIKKIINEPAKLTETGVRSAVPRKIIRIRPWRKRHKRNVTKRLVSLFSSRVDRFWSTPPQGVRILPTFIP